MSSPVDPIRDELRRALLGDAWHGPALLEVMAGMEADDASARVLPGEHTAWEVALHALGWTEEVTRRLVGPDVEPALPARGNWPTMPDPPDQAAWSSTLAALDSAGTALDAALAAMPADRLDERVGSLNGDASIGTGVSVAAMLHGLAQHHAYHAGQLALLKRAAAGRRGPA